MEQMQISGTPGRTHRSPQARDRIRFVGNVSHKELIGGLHDADIVVNPSLSESLGFLSWKEWPAEFRWWNAGRGMCESILDGHTGMLVEAMLRANSRRH